MAISAQSHGTLRVAIEGCGHGKLHDIYASVQESCRAQGWDGVDLLIIGGDFQAVRNQWDLNVTAMPQRYRRIGDFHEYYSGQKMAPYLTIFIGGNHEASNYLFELYYGGWAAPNIYYMGAANVIQIGPLRIAGLSGIWKGYDYRKPHFERLPYNQEELSSTYHVRNIDVRKLLSLRSQVDIGLSHDWPQGVEWWGGYEKLFQKKRGFEKDAKSGKLGSVAARHCLDRLRPAYWFSAHLHVRYMAVLFQQDHPDVIAYANRARPKGVSAWQNFPAIVQKADAEERARILQERQHNANDRKAGPQYTLNETFRKVTVGDDLVRRIEEQHAQELSQDIDDIGLPDQFDGAPSRPSKRLRQISPRNKDLQDDDDESKQENLHETKKADIRTSTEKSNQQTTLHNPDAIDIEISESGEDSAENVGAKLPGPKAQGYQNAKSLSADPSDAKRRASSGSSSSETEDGGLRLPSGPDLLSDAKDAPQDNNALQPSAKESARADRALSSVHTNENGDAGQNVITEDVKNEAAEAMMRIELAAQRKRPGYPNTDDAESQLPFPDQIFNKKTSFLALDKAEPSHDFLQLLDLKSITAPDLAVERPVKLQYDPEWLAILRVFAPELSLGGHSSDRTPPPLGETLYQERIVEERKWIDEHVVRPGRLQVPENFSITAPIYNPNIQIGPNDSPREVTNPQTNDFCTLIGIENPFDITEQERDERMAKGRKAPSAQFFEYQSRLRHGNRGGWRGRGGGRSRGRNHFTPDSGRTAVDIDQRSSLLSHRRMSQ